MFHTATHCNALQHTATHCNTLQHTATHCNTLQHTQVNSWLNVPHSVQIQIRPNISLQGNLIFFLGWKSRSPEKAVPSKSFTISTGNAILGWIWMGFQSIWYPSGTLLMRVLCCGVLQCVVVCCMFVASSKLLWNPHDIQTSWKQSIFIWICIVRYQKMLSPQNRLQLPLEMLFWENAVLGWISMGFHKSWKQSIWIWICIARYQKIWFFWGLVIKGVATHCNTLQHTATHCNTLQHTKGSYN